LKRGFRLGSDFWIVIRGKRQENVNVALLPKFACDRRTEQHGESQIRNVPGVIYETAERRIERFWNR
jgi:hypothetical protein